MFLLTRFQFHRNCVQCFSIEWSLDCSTAEKYVFRILRKQEVILIDGLLIIMEVILMNTRIRMTS